MQSTHEVRAELLTVGDAVAFHSARRRLPTFKRITRCVVLTEEVRVWVAGDTKPIVMRVGQRVEVSP